MNLNIDADLYIDIQHVGTCAGGHSPGIRGAAHPADIYMWTHGSGSADVSIALAADVDAGYAHDALYMSVCPNVRAAPH